MGFWILAAALSSPTPAYPLAPTVLVYTVRDYAGRSFPSVTVKSEGGRVRLEGFGHSFVYDGRAWHSEGEIPDDAAAVAAFQAVVRCEDGARCDAFGRPVLIPELPAGGRSARVDYRYDATGLLAANLLFPDGSGFEFRRVSASPASFTPADFEPPQKVEPPRAPASPAAGPSSAAPDYAAVARLTALQITDREQREFEKSGAVGRYGAKPR